MQHIPVLLKKVMEMLDPQKGDRILDCTVGLGGHAKEFLKALGSSGYLIGLDADEENLKVAGENLRNYANATFVHGNFAQFFSEPLSLTLSPREREYNIIFADLGLSSPHIDDPVRGFSYRFEGPLDLRFDRSQGETAAELIARISEKELADILFQFGELRESRRFARAIKKSSVRTTGDLKKSIEDAVGWRAPKILPQVFQALRIAVNDELRALKILLDKGPTILKSGGRMGVISYHSLEDRMVKHAFRRLCAASDTFECLTKKPIVPSEEEVTHNPRSRSAKFRVIQKRNIV